MQGPNGIEITSLEAPLPLLNSSFYGVNHHLRESEKRWNCSWQASSSRLSLHVRAVAWNSLLKPHENLGIFWRIIAHYCLGRLGWTLNQVSPFFFFPLFLGRNTHLIIVKLPGNRIPVSVRKVRPKVLWLLLPFKTFWILWQNEKSALGVSKFPHYQKCNDFQLDRD